jgi:ABC-2 type transport system permease protein
VTGGTATIGWLAAHEMRLSWREFIHMITAGRRTRLRTSIILMVVFVVAMHLLVRPLVLPYADYAIDPAKAEYVTVTGTLVLWCSLLLSQAMESVTRVFYSRSDLDLLLTSPMSPFRIFAVRICQIAVSVSLVATLLAAPFINVLAYKASWRWLLAYGVVIALGAAATAFAVALTVMLFRTIGAKRTRLISQIVAAVIGAAFVIGLQVIAILSYGNLSRFTPLQSGWLVEHAPDIGNVIYLPARAVMGEFSALAIVVSAGLALLGLAIALFARRFGEHTLAAAGIAHAVVRHRRRSSGFRAGTPSAMLRRKEWALLRRDPWLISQTLMQLLYLLPPALLLWRDFSKNYDGMVVLVPVLVMAAGQLGGGLAWLSISGEDAPELIATAPVDQRRVLQAKIEAVMGAVGLVFVPLIAAMAFASPLAALVAMAGVVAASGSATLIQLHFRVQARRNQFRRRQTSSRLTTFAEALSSISWAAAAGMALHGTWHALEPAGFALAILTGTWLMRRRHEKPRRLPSSMSPALAP